MTKRSEAIRKKEDSLAVFDAEIVDNEVVPLIKSDLSRRENTKSPAYNFGKIVGFLGSFLLGLLNSKKYFNTNNNMGKGGSGRRYREKKRGKRRKGNKREV